MNSIIASGIVGVVLGFSGATLLGFREGVKTATNELVKEHVLKTIDNDKFQERVIEIVKEKLDFPEIDKDNLKERIFELVKDETHFPKKE